MLELKSFVQVCKARNSVFQLFEYCNNGLIRKLKLSYLLNTQACAHSEL